MSDETKCILDLNELLVVLEARDYNKADATPTERCIWEHLTVSSRAQRAAAIATLDKCYPKDAEDGNAVPFMRKQYMEWINEHFPGGETDG